MQFLATWLLRFSLSVLCLTFVSSNGTNAQITKQGGAYLFRMKLTKGATASYLFTTSATAPGGQQGSFSMSMTMNSKVLSVSGDVATVEYVVTPAKGSPGGTTPQKMTAKINSRGKVVGGDKQMAQMGFQSALPEKPVPVGGSWSDTIPVQTAMGTITTKANYRLTGISSRAGKPVANIQVDMNGSGPSLSFTGKGTLALRMDDGSMDNLTMQQTMKLGGGSGGKQVDVKVNVKMSRTK